MELAELKKQNEEEAAILAVEPEVEVVEPEVEPEIEPEPDPEPELDEDGKPIEKKAAEPWMDAEGQPYDDVPVKTHVLRVQKLKGRVSEKTEENERQKVEIAALKAQIQTTPTELKRPIAEDFATDEEYHAALDKYQDDRSDDRADRRDIRKGQTDAIAQATVKRDKAVVEHYERANKLIENSSVSQENYKKADTIVRDAIESVIPGSGMIVTDHAISILGEGSEKVIYNLGVNKANRLEFIELLREEPQQGLKAIAYLARLQERLIKPKKGTSTARSPATQVKGDGATVSAKGRAAKKKYDDAHAKGEAQVAYDIKKQAKIDKVDTSPW